MNAVVAASILAWSAKSCTVKNGNLASSLLSDFIGDGAFATAATKLANLAFLGSIPVAIYFMMFARQNAAPINAAAPSAYFPLLFLKFLFILLKKFCFLYFIMRRTGRYTRRPRARYSRSTGSQISSYMNPFTTATDVKIPDGKSLLSKGIKHNQSFSLGLETDTCTLIIFPGLSNGFQILNGTLNGSSGATTQVYDNAPVRDFLTNEWQNEQINKWRLVSQGCKINMVNNMDDNDGWFEAARCNVSFGDNPDFIYVNNGGNALLSPSETFPYVVASENMANSPSYMTGTLKNIGKYKFHLMPTSREHEFHRICTAGTSTGSDLKDEGDESHDCIVIRLHGKAGVTQLHVQHVANHEYEFHHTSSLHHTQTYSVAAPGAVSRVNNMKKSFGRRAGSVARSSWRGIRRTRFRRNPNFRSNTSRGIQLPFTMYRR